MTNQLYYGDNLDVLRRKIAGESVDLCYIDPPFNSKRNYFQIYNNQGGEDRAQTPRPADGARRRGQGRRAGRCRQAIGVDLKCHYFTRRRGERGDL